MNFTEKRLLSALISAAVAVSALPFGAAAEEQEIVTISDPSALWEFAAQVNSGSDFDGVTVRLAANIDLGGEDSPWTPIGNADTPFRGVFDGEDHVISGLYVSGGASVGFFGEIDGGNVEELVVRGKVSGSSDVGGIVGRLTAGNITDCGNEAEVSGAADVGGIVGSVNGDCTISGCYNKGSVSGTTGYIGGISGQHWRSGKLINCRNLGEVSGPATVGGVAGGHKAASVQLENCFNAAKVTDTAGAANNIGAVVGASRGTNTNCYYLSGTGSNDKSGISQADRITADMLGSAFVDGEDLPLLAWEKNISEEPPASSQFVEKSALSAQLAVYIRAAVNSAKQHAGLSQEDSLLGNDDFLSSASSTDTDWMALAMGRFGYYSNGYHYMIDDGGYEKYLTAMNGYIEDTYSRSGGLLHRIKATEWHRAAVTIAALGGDPKNCGTYKEKAIDIIADGSYNCVLDKGPGAQGINGWIWGLISLDSINAEVPENAKYDRERFITEILKMQLTDGVEGSEYGGWVLGGYGSSSDVDITAMAIQALAPYYNDDTVYTFTNENSKAQRSVTVRRCVDEALDRLGSMMDDDAGFSSWSTNNVEGVSQVLVALCSLGIDPARDERFITPNGKTILDGLLRFRLEDGGFSHIMGGGWNSMATDQAAYALVSYWRFENEMRALYDMREDTDRSAQITDAESAIELIPQPGENGYREAVGNAYAAVKKVAPDERRYIRNYGRLARGLEILDGHTDTDEPYICAVEITALPYKTEYIEGDIFERDGLKVTAHYSDGSEKLLDDYTVYPSGELAAGTENIYIITKAFKEKINIRVVRKMPWTGEGSEDSPYIINNAEQLTALAERVNDGESFSGKYFALGDNTDLSAVGDWTPIGYYSSRPFEGIFNGCGYAVDNLVSSKGGLFGYASDGARIENVILASGSINTSSLFVGGILGWSSGADVINCQNGAEIVCGGYSGGVVGTVRSGESVISGCCNTAGVTSAYGTAVGGIVGHLAANVSADVENCYNSGDVSGNMSVGGIAGALQDGHRIYNCYNCGKLTATGTFTNVDGELVYDLPGGIAGMATSDNSIENCYYDNAYARSAVGGEEDGEGVLGMETLQMKEDKFLEILGDMFKADRYGLVNGGYPLLIYQNTFDADDIDDVVQRIENIGEVDKDSAQRISAAREAYDSLSDELKGYVGNYDLLTAAEKRFEELSRQPVVPDDEDKDNDNESKEPDSSQDKDTDDKSEETDSSQDKDTDNKSEETDSDQDKDTDNKSENADSSGANKQDELPDTGTSAAAAFAVTIAAALLCIKKK